MKESKRIALGKTEMDEDCEELYLGHSSKEKAENMMEKFLEETGGEDDGADEEELKDDVSPEFSLFQAICNQNPSQVLRYKRSGEVPALLYSPEDRKVMEGMPSVCKHCGGPLIV